MNKLNLKISKSIWLQVFLFLALMVVLFVGYRSVEKYILKIFNVAESNFDWIYQVDEIKEKNNELIVKGFAFIKNQRACDTEYNVFLRNIENDERYIADVEYEKREDVNKYFQCNYDYLESGFIARFPLSKLDVENEVYEVLICQDGADTGFSLGAYYTNGKMLFTNPCFFLEPEVAGTDLENIVSEGTLRTFCFDYMTYIYQYEGALYWIIEGDDNFINEDWYVQFQMNTTQVDKLPEDRILQNNLWSNMGFLFSQNELLGLSNGKYRVAKCNLPTEYSIANIWTGNYIDEGIIWKEEFFPRYEFDDR